MNPKQSLLKIAVRIFLNENAGQEVASGRDGWNHESRLRDV
jgi:hypothetical protein